jgi:hypothetical protein
MPENDDLIGEDEMFVLSLDPGREPVPEEIAASRGDIPDEDTLDLPVELVLDDDQRENLEDLKKSLEEGEDKAAVDVEAKESAKDAGKPEIADGQEKEKLEEKSDGGDDKGPPVTVPYGRFAEKVAELAELRQRIADFENNKAVQGTEKTAKQDEVPAFDLAAKYREYADLVADGDTEAAADIMLAIDQHKDRLAEERFNRNSEQREARNKAQGIVDEIIETHGEWFADDINKETFNATKLALMKRGMSLPVALAEARKRFFGDPAEKEGEESTTKQDDVAKKKTEQTKATVEKNAKASIAQPAAMDGGRGNRTAPQQKNNALAYTQAEYNAMSERDKRIARGDLT